MIKKQLSRIKKELQNTQALEQCAREFGVVGDETRLKICYLLCKYPELSVSNIAKLAKVSVSTASHSLARLKEIDMVKSRRDAQTMYYSLKKSSLSSFLQEYLSRSL